MSLKPIFKISETLEQNIAISQEGHNFPYLLLDAPSKNEFPGQS